MIEPDIVCRLDRDREAMERIGIDDCPGCYAVFDGDTCLYVGRSKRLLTRICSHWIDQKDGNGVKWRLAGLTEWYFKRTFAPELSVLKVWTTDDYVEMELKLIEKFEPTYNGLKYHQMIEPMGNQKVIVTMVGGVRRYGTIRGESRDYKCWRVQLDGNGYKTVGNYAKSRCEIVVIEELIHE